MRNSLLSSAVLVLAIPCVAAQLACGGSTEAKPPPAVVPAPPPPPGSLADASAPAPTTPPTTPTAAPEPPPPATATTSPADTRTAAPEAIYGSWHQDQAAPQKDRSVFVPKSVELGPSHYRPTLDFGKDGSFSTLRLHPADAHYQCKGFFTAPSKTELKATCFDAEKKGEVKFTIKVLEAKPKKLVVQIKEE